MVELAIKSENLWIIRTRKGGLTAYRKDSEGMEANKTLAADGAREGRLAMIPCQRRRPFICRSRARKAKKPRFD